MERIAVQMAELEVLLHDALCSSSGYPGIRVVTATPSLIEPCGWTADVKGDFAEADSHTFRATIIELQKRYSLVSSD